MTKNRLFIIGAGGFGREIFTYIMRDGMEHYEFAGFIDDNPNAFKNHPSYGAVAGGVSDFSFREGDVVIIAIADITIKRNIVAQLKNKVEFCSYIDKNIDIPENSKIGDGVILCPGVRIGPDSVIGDFVSINVNSVIGHDAQIGNYCSIMPNVDIGGGAKLEQGVYMGTKATVAPLVSICEGSFLGVGSINIKDTKEAGIYFGNPARRTR